MSEPPNLNAAMVSRKLTSKDEDVLPLRMVRAFIPATVVPGRHLTSTMAVAPTTTVATHTRMIRGFLPASMAVATPTTMAVTSPTTTTGTIPTTMAVNSKSIIKLEPDDSSMEVAKEDKEVLAWLREGLDQCVTTPKEELPEGDVEVFDAIVMQEDDDQMEEDFQSDLPSTSSSTASGVPHLEYIVECGDISVLIHARGKRSILRAAVRKLNKLKSCHLKVDECELEVLHPHFNKYYLIVDEEDVPNNGILRLRTGGTLLAKQPCSNDEPHNSSGSAELSNEWPSLGFRRNWPDIFDLPTSRFSPMLRQGLKSKAPLDRRSEKELIALLYEEIIKYTFYPTKSQTKDLVADLFEKFPHLYQGLTEAEALKYWRLKISNKMRNMRQSRDKNVAVVQKTRTQTVCLKEKLAYTDGSGKPPSAALFPVKYKCWKRPTNVDPEIIKKHKELMQRLEQENSPFINNLEIIQTAMDATFIERRYFILNNRAPIAAIKNEFPCLFDGSQMLLEFHRLMKFSAMDKMELALLNRGKAIIELTRKEGVFHGDETSEELPEEHDTDLLVHRAICCIPLLVHEPIFRVGLSQLTPEMLESAGDSPVLTIEGDMTRADGPLLGKVTSGEVLVCHISGKLVLIIATWLASCYTLNRRFPIHGRRTLSFVETVLLGVDNSKISLRNNRLRRTLNVASTDEGS